MAAGFRAAASIFFASLASTLAWPAPPILEWPVACTPNRDCWIANHVDLDPGTGARDYACGSLTYENHNGTDIAVRDRLAMEEGVEVRAAAAGRVKGVRDGVVDESVRDAGKDATRNRECGNGVVIEHGDGWETQYCHLRRGSVRVRHLQEIAAGQPLGLVGLSGLTEYPHLHLTVRHKGLVVDPFRGPKAGTQCGLADSLWRAGDLAALPYAPGAVYNAGFAPEMPTVDSIRSGQYRKARRLEADAPALAFYVEVFGVRPGDVLELLVTAPDGGPVIERRVVFDKTQARRYSAVGRRRTAPAWPPGIYRGEARLVRADGGMSPASILFAEIDVGTPGQ
jgi:murein DD-endopeptidase MepM/ murein hydrolase activator NlpD